MTNFLISPAERAPITALGPNSPVPESLGFDIVWEAHDKMCGAQRKTYFDLIASVRDNRLGKEIVQMQGTEQRFLILEGTPAWDSDGTLANAHVIWTLKMQWGAELSIQAGGIPIIRTRTAMETVSACEYLRDRTRKKQGGASSLLGRGGPPRNGWGRVTEKNFAIYMMSSLPGVSVGRAEKLFDHFGRSILGLAVSEEELLAVPGLGKKTVQAITDALGQTSSVR